jgi:pimeloyl-ACP methyl ester carboxylesterase|tara:strand:- start:369 stop:1070 length:702 start_codon:yes stop_codon:yes gene_type:complete
MKLDPVLLNMAVSWAMNAYKEKNKDAIKIESKWTSTTVYVAKRKSIDIIAFRGTQQGRDWLTDALVVPVPYAGRLCHGGFVAAHASVWKEVEKHIDPKKRTLICGHSLGGALAELSAAKLNGKHDNINLVTFGKPNTFFKGFKKPMTLDTQISCVNGSDAVARIPRLCYGPSKSQDMLYFSNGGVDYINPSSYLRKKDRGIKDRISDHFMDGYKARLVKFLEDQKNGKTGVDI